MPIGEFAIRDVITTSRETSVLEAAQLMRKHHVGDIVVSDKAGKRNVPVGILTDRDIVMEVLAQNVDSTKITVGDIMTEGLITIKQSEGVWRAVELVRAKGVRRLPVVDNDGSLAGIVSVDDLIELLADELGAVAKLIAREQKREVTVRR